MRFHDLVHGVYFDDLDAFQILHNARYLLLFEHAIGSFWRHLGLAGELDFNTDSDQHHLVAANHIDYHRPVVGTGQVRVRIWVKKLGRSSLTFGMRVMPVDQDVDYATGYRVVVRIDPQLRTSVPWTDGFRELLADYREDAGTSPG